MTPTRKINPDGADDICAAKHGKIMVWLLLLVFTPIAGIAVWASSRDDEIRNITLQNKQDIAVANKQFESIKETLDKIERHLSRRDAAAKVDQKTDAL